MILTDKNLSAFFEKLAEISVGLSSNMSSTKSDPMSGSSTSNPIRPYSPPKSGQKMPGVTQYTSHKSPGGVASMAINSPV